MDDRREWNQLYVGGRWQDSAATARIEIISPATEQVIGSTPEAVVADVDAAVHAARTAFDHGPWPRLTPTERAVPLRRLTDLYGARLDDMAQLITAEMGSPISFSQFGQSAGAWALLDFYAGLADEFTWEERRRGYAGGEAIVRRTPVGVVAAITPWNVPQIAILSKLVPALLAGCTVVVKPSPETAIDALVLAQWVDEIGFPEGVVSIIPGGREAGEHLVRSAGVDKVAFTGSTAAGRKIGAICGEALRRVSLELGGKSAALVLADAGIERTVECLRFASFMNSSQACAAQTRILVPRERYDDYVDAMAALADSLVVGDPADPATEIGPMVARRQQERVSGYIQIGIDEGARVASGGPGMPAGVDRGWFVRPTILAGDNSMRVAREEIFGPVIVVIAYDGEDDGVSQANDSEYGLAGSVWTADKAHGVDVARRIHAGTVGVNKYGPDYVGPFGGFKNSGIGREYGVEGLEEFTELQNIAP